MKLNAFLSMFVIFTLSACGPGKPAATSPKGVRTSHAPSQASPEYDSIGVIAEVKGQVVTLDHEGASAAKLAAGRTLFQAYADALAEAPLKPGTRVAFKFRKIGETYELTDLTVR
jgi:hypothetical protein